MRAREGLSDQLTAVCFYPPPSHSIPTPTILPFALNPASQPPTEPDESSCSNAGGETAIKLARTTDLLFRLPSGFPPCAPFLRGNETAGNATPALPTTSSFQPRKVSARSDLRCTRAHWLAAMLVREDEGLIFFFAREIWTRRNYVIINVY